MKHRFRTWAGIAILLLIALLVALALRGGAGVEVDVEAVARRDVFRSTVSASGEIVATRYADVGSDVMGRVVELPVDEGDRVEAGQVVARLDAVQARSAAEAAAAQAQALEAEARSARERVAAARSELEVAAARAEEARKTLRRTRRLFADGVMPAAQLDAAEAAAEAAEGQLTAARAEVSRAEQALAAAERRIASARAQAAGARDLLAKTEIVAPISGVVTRLDVRRGEMVVIGIQNQPGTTLMTISDLASLTAEVQVAEADVLRLEEGQAATVTLEALPGGPFAGRVSEIGASALPPVGPGAAAREFRVLVALDQPDPRLRPGLTCDAEIVTDEKHDVLTVPLQAVVLRPGAGGEEVSGVFAAEAGRARFVPVTAGIVGGIDIEVEGVAEGAPVVVGPFQVLRELLDGDHVRATPLGRS